MQCILNEIKAKVKRKATTIILFSYGILVGTGAPILLSRCTTNGSNCAACGGFCSLALGILPLVLFLTMRSRITRFAQRIFGIIRKTEKPA